NEQPALDDIVTFQRQQKRMADLLDSLEGLQFLFRMASAVWVGRAHVTVNDLDGLDEAARGFGLPDIAETTPAQPVDQAVARDRLGVADDLQCHEAILERAPRRGGESAVVRCFLSLAWKFATRKST